VQEGVPPAGGPSKRRCLPPSIGVQNLRQQLADAQGLALSPTQQPPLLHTRPAAERPPAQPLRNVHEHVVGPPTAGAGSRIVTAAGSCWFYHYSHRDDAGWDCAYRVGQTLWSWRAERSQVPESLVPTVPEMQRDIARQLPDGSGAAAGAGSETGMVELLYWLLSRDLPPEV
jgi:hypothetical protein